MQLLIVNDSWLFSARLGRSSFVFYAYKNTFALTISASEAKRMLSRGCVAYLASVDHALQTIPALEDIPVAREFTDVFPTEIPEMPPDRAAEFVIELVPSTAPISKAPYRMSFVELKELESQLEDLLDKDFIRPSVPPWGATVLLVQKKDGSLRCVLTIES